MKTVKEYMNQSANGMVPLATVLENVHTVNLPAFENLSELHSQIKEDRKE